MKVLTKILLIHLMFVSAVVFADSDSKKYFSDEFLNRLTAAPFASASLIMASKAAPRDSEVERLMVRPSLGHRPIEPRRMDFPLPGTEPILDLNRGEIARIVDYLGKSEPISIEERFRSCQFQPGLRFAFHGRLSANTRMPVPFYTVLLCLNCDVWAVIKDPGATGTQQGEGIAYLDSRPFRADLLEIKHRLDVVTETSKHSEITN